MLTVRPLDHAREVPAQTSGKTRVLGVLPDDVVVVDCRAPNPVLGRAEHVHIRATDEELFKAEHAAPDGSAASPHERHFIPWLIAGLALGGLLIVGVGMYAAGGVQAMAVGLAWIIAGYAVAWIVVWAASLARARDEAVIENEIIIRNLNDVTPQDSINVR